jgi:Protein of unknown function (DUF3631)
MDEDQEILDGIEAATLASLDLASLALIDVLAVLTSQGADRLHSEDILLALQGEEAWSAWASLPMPAAASRLGELLGEHGVRPRSVTVAGRRARGYRREELEAAWGAHLGRQ